MIYKHMHNVQFISFITLQYYLFTQTLNLLLLRYLVHLNDKRVLNLINPVTEYLTDNRSALDKIKTQRKIRGDH